MRNLPRNLQSDVLRSGLFLLPILFLLPHLGEFPFQRGADFSDLVVSHYPNALFLKQTLLTWKAVPLWSPAILSGYPFGANPLSGLYYPPGWLALLFPLPAGINLIVALHLIWGGVGMYRLLRLEGLSERAALLGGLAFEAMPKLYSHLGAGHISIICAVAWTPWLLYAERHAGDLHGRRFFFPGLVLGITALADVRWAAYAGLIWLAYSPMRWLTGARPVVGEGWARKAFRAVRGWLPLRLLNVLLALLTAAPVLLPLLEYTRLTTRSQLTAQESFTLSMPFGQLLGLVYPDIGGTAEWMLYPGAVMLALGLYTLTRAAVRQRAGFWLVVLLGTLLFSLGSNLPFLEGIAGLPGMDLLRVPPRVLFLSGFCMAAAAAVGLDDLLDRIQHPEQPARNHSGLVMFGAAAFVAFFAVAVWMVVDNDQRRLQFAWGAVFFVIGAAAVLLARARRISAGGLVLLVIGAGLADLVGVNALSLEFRRFETVFAQGRPAADYLIRHAEGQPFRIYSPSYSIPQHVAAWYGLELADGVDPLQLAAYAAYMEQASGVPVEGYSVTLPPFANGSPATDNQDYAPDAALLGLLNVKYVVSAFPLPEDGLVLLEKFDQTNIYQNQRALPRAWVQAVEAPLGQQILSEPDVKSSPDALQLNAAGPGLLVLSELAYPGWQATIDGQAATVETVGGILRGVHLPAGEHAVRFAFRPWSVYIGAAGACLTWAALLFLWIRRGRSGQRQAWGDARHD